MSFGMIMYTQNMMRKENFVFIVSIKVDDTYKDVAEIFQIRLILQIMN